MLFRRTFALFVALSFATAVPDPALAQRSVARSSRDPRDGRARAYEIARARITGLSRALRGARLVGSTPANNGAVASVRSARIARTRQSVVIRHPDDVRMAVRLHNAVVILAH